MVCKKRQDSKLKNTDNNLELEEFDPDRNTLTGTKLSAAENQRDESKVTTINLNEKMIKYKFKDTGLITEEDKKNKSIDSYLGDNSDESDNFSKGGSSEEWDNIEDLKPIGSQGLNTDQRISLVRKSTQMQNLIGMNKIKEEDEDFEEDLYQSEIFLNDTEFVPTEDKRKDRQGL